MKNGNPWIVPVFVMCCITAPLSARGADQPSAEGRAGGSAEGGPERGYQLLFGGLEDLNSVASLGVNGYAFLSDLYTFGIGPHLPPGIEGIADMVWQTWWSFMLTIWPHEFGH